MSLLTLNAQEVIIGLHANGCGHTIVLTREHYDACRETGRIWFCTVCGCQRQFTGKTTLEQLRGELAAAKQREETEKALRRKLEETVCKARASSIRLRERLKNGVCPCCTRSFQNLRRHIATKHPEFAVKVE